MMQGWEAHVLLGQVVCGGWVGLLVAVAIIRFSRSLCISMPAVFVHGPPQRQWVFYFLRSPLFHVITKPVADLVSEGSLRCPRTPIHPHMNHAVHLLSRSFVYLSLFWRAFVGIARLRGCRAAGCLFFFLKPGRSLLRPNVRVQATFLVCWIPLVGMLAAYLRDMLCFFQRHHFYTSASS